MGNVGKFKIPILMKTVIILLIIGFLYMIMSLVSLCGHQGRENYPGAVLNEVYGYFQTGLYYVDHFPKNEDEIFKMFEIVKQKEPNMAEPLYKWKLKYRLVEEKDNEVIFLIIVDSTADFDFLTYSGSINTGLGRAKRDEKGEWHGTLEWFYKTSTVVEKFSS